MLGRLALVEAEADVWRSRMGMEFLVGARARPGRTTATTLDGRVAPLPSLVAAVCAGCGRQSAPPRADEEAKTGPHGGALVTLPAETVRSAGIVVDSVQSRPIEVTIELPGEIKLNTEHSVDVRPTYPGRVSALSAALGASVQSGESSGRLQQRV